MSLVSLLSLASLFLAAPMAAQAGDDGGLNPQFLKWRKMKAAGMLPQQKAEARERKAARDAAQKGISLTAAKGASMVGVDDQPAGLAPDVKSFSYLADIVGTKSWSPVDGYPRRFDLRDYGEVTGVRNQGDFETCWAFAAIGSLESAVLVQKPEDYTYTAADIDFSERHMVDNHGFDLTAKQGGNMLMSMAYLLRWGGPVSEADSPYPAPGTTEWARSSVVADPRLHVQQVRWIPGKTTYTDNDEIKNAVMNYGAVYTTFFMDKKTYYNEATHSYRCPFSMQNNHGVLIVGWDDDYPASNFGKIFLDNILIGDGAYLVKNSWGSDWGDGGYFWVSYYDHNFAVSAMAVISGNESKSNYATIYQYDELGYTGESFKPGDSRVNGGWMANVFTATADDQIAAVGFYVLAPNTSYQIRVYTDIPEGGDPKDGTLKYSNTQTGSFSYAGYVTVPLDKVVPVSAGTRFAVCVNLTCKGSEVKPLAYEAPVAGYSTLAHAANGQSFYSSNGNKWTDLTSLAKYKGANFCLKAYGIADQDEDEHIESVTPVSLDVIGPTVIAAGATGEFVITTVFDDNSRYDLDVMATVVSGGAAISSMVEDDNKVRFTVKSDLAEDVRVVVNFSTYDSLTDITVEKEIAFTATMALPAVPTDFIATEGTVDSGVRMSWTEVANASSYSIYRSETGDPNNATFLASVEGGRYTDLTAVPGQDYTYFLKAVNSSGSSDFTEGRHGWRKLAAPENLAATDGDFDYVQLTWDAAEGANYYKVYRAEDMDAEGNPDTNTLVEVSEWIDQLAFRDTPPVKDKVYFYWVKSALSWTGYRASDYSIFDPGNRKAPVTLSAVAIQGAATVPAGTTASYTLMAELSNGSRIENVTNAVWSVGGGVGHTALPSGALELEALVNGELVASNTMVTVTATWSFTNEDGTTSKTDSKVVVIAPVVPAKPNAVKVASLTTDGADLEWNPVEGASSYNLYRGETVETAVLLLSTSELTYTDTKLIPGATYRYWLEAVNAAGASEKSDASADAMRQFSAPIYVSASNGTSTEDVTVTWRGVTGANYYRVSRADAPDGEKHDLSGWIDRRTFADTTAEPGVTYWYFVEAAYDANGGSGSAYSAATIGKVSAAQTLTFIEIDGPSVIQFDSQGAYVCTATYANGAEKRVQPTWSFKAAHPLVSVSADGIVSAGHVEGDDLHLELQASYTDNGITKTDSFAVTVVAFKPVVPQVFVSNVVVRARWPWNGLVDISYDLYSVPATTRAVVTVSGHDHDLNRELQAVSLEGDGVVRPASGGNPHIDCRVTWNLGADYTNFHASAFSVSLDAAPFAVAAPADFRASDGTTTNGVELAWEEAFGAEYYEIFRSLHNTTNDATKVATVTNVTEYLDSTTESGETYYYWIRTIAGEFPEDVSDLAGPAKGVRMMPPYEATPVNLQDGLVAYYPFDGDLDDASGNNHHLAFVTGDDPVVAESRGASSGAARRFAAATQLNATTNLAAVLSGSFTFSAWVQTSFRQTLRAEQRVGFNTGCNFLVQPVRSATANVASYGISVAANGVNVFEYNDVYLPAVVRYPASLGDGWHFVAFTVDENGSPMLYVDGVFAKAGISTGRSKQLYVGENVAGGEFGRFTGDADDICYYDRALTAAEISALYDAGSPLADGKPVSATPAIDVTYAGAVATVTITCVEDGEAPDRQPKVYYTISRADGGNTVESREYTVPFTVEGNATVIAWSVKDGYYNSPRVKAEVKSGWKQNAHDALADTDTDGLIDFDTFGDSDWVFDPNESSDNVSGSMRSGAIGAEGTSSMTAKVSGVGVFAFDWKVSSESEFDYLAVTVDGEFAHKISGEVDWTQLVIDLTNDTEHVITWTYSKDASVNRGRDCGWVDFVTWAPEGSIVDSPVATVTPVDGGASNRVELATVIPGAAIEYRLVIFGEEGEWTAYAGPFVVEGDGEIYMRAKKQGYVDSFVSKDVIKRPWIVRANEALLMDDVTKNAVTLSPDYFEYGFEEAYWWDQDRTTVSDGTWASMKSPKLDNLEAASIYASFSGPGTLYFDRKIDSEAGWDVLTYYAGENGFDYSYAEAISGDRDWERVKLVFYANDTHVIEWEYDKDQFGKNGRDCAWIDYLKWVPARFAPATPDPRTGYVFGGFATNENGVAVYDAGTQLDAEDPNETFFPVWTPITYTIKYAAQAENEYVATTETLTYDQPYTLAAASNFVFRRGYAFGGWATNENGAVAFADEAEVVNLTTEQDAEIVLSPVLNAIGYTVKFFDGEYLADKDINATYDVDYTMPTMAERTGFTFDGWASTPDGEVEFAAGATVKNLADTQDAIVRLYARWTEIPQEDTFGEAIEQPTFEMQTSGDAEWFVQSAVVKHGETALQSGRIGANQSSVLETTLVTANRVRISFWWKVSSEQGWDFLKFSENGAVKGSISGTAGDWQQFTTVIPAGTNTLCWTYAKDGTGDGGDDCGWLDWFEMEDISNVVGDVIHVAVTGSDATGDGSAQNPFRTVQRGVDQANKGATVIVHPGTYNENVEVSEAINLIAIDGPLETTIHGGTAMRAAIHVAEGADGGQIWGFTVTGGRGQDWGVNKYGGAMDFQARTFVRDCIMHGNGCDNLTFAGGVRACGATAYVVFENCLFYDNYAWACGGASLVEGQATTVFSHCTAAGNRSDDFIGQEGGFSVANTGTLIVTNSIAYDNQGLQIAAYGSYYGMESILQVGNSCVQGGVAANGAGSFTDLGGNITSSPDFFSVDGVPYQSNLRATRDMGFSLGAIKRWGGAGEHDNENALFTVTQYPLSKKPWSIADVVAATNKPSIWVGKPVVRTYATINFRDNVKRTQNFNRTTVSWPATVVNGVYPAQSICTIEATLAVSEAGAWTFACGSDDGFLFELTDEDGVVYSFRCDREQAYATTIGRFNLARAGRYRLKMLYFDCGTEGGLDLSCAKGSYNSFSSSMFKLVGTPESGITLVGGNN